MSAIHKANSALATRVASATTAHDHSEPVRVSIPASRFSRTADVHLVREGDAIREIEITCACGEKLRLICEYE